MYSTGSRNVSINASVAADTRRGLALTEIESPTLTICSVHSEPVIIPYIRLRDTIGDESGFNIIFAGSLESAN